MSTTKIIAELFAPNHRIAGIAQQTLGRACSPRASIPRVSRKNLMRAQSTPSGMPKSMPIAYPESIRFKVPQIAESKTPLARLPSR